MTDTEQYVRAMGAALRLGRERKRLQAIVDKLRGEYRAIAVELKTCECECDSYHGYVCLICRLFAASPALRAARIPQAEAVGAEAAATKKHAPADPTEEPSAETRGKET